MRHLCRAIAFPRSDRPARQRGVIASDGNQSRDVGGVDDRFDRRRAWARVIGLPRMRSPAPQTRALVFAHIRASRNRPSRAAPDFCNRNPVEFRHAYGFKTDSRSPGRRVLTRAPAQ